MKYATEQLPWHDFAVLGLDRLQVLSLPQSTLNALLSGNRTALMRFEKVQIPGLAGNYPVDGKLSLKKLASPTGGDEQGKLQLLIHPIHPELKNDFDLSKSELKYLESGKMAFIPKLITGVDGRLEEALISYDQTTNELVAYKREGLKAPDAINGIPLTEQQKKTFLSGESISISNKNYQLDPNNESGIRGDDLQNVTLRHGKYRSAELAMDATLLTAGIGHYVMLWHLGSVLIHSKLIGFNPEKSLQNLSFRNALADAQKEIIQKQEELHKQQFNKKQPSSKTLSIDELKEIIEKKAGEHIVIDKVEVKHKSDQADQTNLSVVQKKDEPDNIDIDNKSTESRSFKL